MSTGKCCAWPVFRLSVCQKSLLEASMFGNTLQDVMDLQKDRNPNRQLPWIQVTLSEALLNSQGTRILEGIFRSVHQWVITDYLTLLYPTSPYHILRYAILFYLVLLYYILPYLMQHYHSLSYIFIHFNSHCMVTVYYITLPYLTLPYPILLPCFVLPNFTISYALPVPYLCLLIRPCLQYHILPLRYLSGCFFL